MKVVCTIASETALKPVKAIVMYSDGAKSLCTVHDVMDADGVPMLRPGILLRKSDLMRIVNKLDGETPMEGVVPSNLLYVSDCKVVWYCPAAIRQMFFKTKVEALNKISGKPVAYPALLFKACGSGLSVWALRHNRRPLESDEVYKAPFMNVYDSGRVCMPEADECSVKSIGAWEDIFFCSFFTHMNANTVVKGGHDKFWVEHVGCTKFPASCLIKAGIKVRNVYASN